MTDRAKRIRIEIRSNSTFEHRDGLWHAHFPTVDARATGGTEDEAFQDLVRAIGERLEESEEARVAWSDYVKRYGVEEDVPDEELQSHQSTVERSHEASAGFRKLDDSTFDGAIASETPVLVDFWAEWCMPCHMIAPVLKEVADTLEGRMTVAKVNVDDHKGMWARFGISGIPTMILFRAGSEVTRIVGAGRTKEQMLGELEPHLGRAPGKG